MYKKLISYTPEQIFLVQGNESVFTELTESISEIVPTTEHETLARFTKEDAQRVISFNLERAPGAWLVVYFGVFMSDAAQVLLKTLEEPNEGIHIVFVTSHPYLVPQTIRSRVRLIIPGNKDSQEQNTPEYLSSKKEVLSYIPVFGDEDIDASERRAMATVFLDEVEKLVRSDTEKIKAVYEAKDMLYKANMPTKQVIEYLVTMIF